MHLESPVIGVCIGLAIARSSFAVEANHTAVCLGDHFSRDGFEADTHARVERLDDLPHKHIVSRVRVGYRRTAFDRPDGIIREQFKRAAVTWGSGFKAFSYEEFVLRGLGAAVCIYKLSQNFGMEKGEPASARCERAQRYSSDSHADRSKMKSHIRSEPTQLAVRSRLAGAKAK